MEVDPLPSERCVIVLEVDCGLVGPEDVARSALAAVEQLDGVRVRRFHLTRRQLAQRVLAALSLG